MMKNTAPGGHRVYNPSCSGGHIGNPGKMDGSQEAKKEIPAKEMICSDSLVSYIVIWSQAGKPETLVDFLSEEVYVF